MKVKDILTLTAKMQTVCIENTENECFVLNEAETIEQTNPELLEKDVFMIYPEGYKALCSMMGITIVIDD